MGPSAFLMLFGLCPFLTVSNPPAVRITFNPAPVPREGFPNWATAGFHVI